MAEEASTVPEVLRPPVDPADLEEAEKAKGEANLAFKGEGGGGVARPAVAIVVK
jgi:hypothetical protein